MISICIPVYNYEVFDLAQSLSTEASTLSIPIEVIIIDDASASEFKSQNEKLHSIETVRYIELDNNVGRSAIRNLLASKAKFENLLFIDCDAQYQPDFLKKYIEIITPNTVVIGGVAYSAEKPSKNILFRWRYGVQRESTNAIERSKHPYNSFKTFNFLIPKNIFESVKFDERLTGYGHEDTLFGIALKKQQIPVIHIQNPLIHLGLETNDVFLRKTEIGIDNLYKLYLSPNTDSDFRRSVGLLRIYRMMPNFIKFLTSIAFNIFRTRIKYALESGICPIRIFDIYKIGYLCNLKYSRL